MTHILNCDNKYLLVKCYIKRLIAQHDFRS